MKIPPLLLLAILWTVVQGPSIAAQQPNIVFIVADDLGWADTTLYSHTALYQTPNLERLAARGMTFDRAYTASPLCSPTRSSILTGLHPARTGLTTPNCHTPTVVLEATIGDTAKPNQKLLPLKTVSRLDTKYPTLSKALKAAGYTTAHFGKWHLGPEPYSPLQHGFDIDIPHHAGPGPAGSYVAPWKFKDFAEKYPLEHIEDRMGDEAVAFLKKHKNTPFFLNYWMFSVHAPFDAKADLIQNHQARIDPGDEQRSPTYAAMIESLDDNVGKILDALDNLNLSENTIIIFFSDNGGNMYNEIDDTTPTSNRPLRGGKGNNFDGGTRVPAIVVWPSQTQPGSRSDTLITSTDFYPTILEMLELPPLPGQAFDGISIVPALQGTSLNRPGDAIFTYFPHSTKVPDTLPPSVGIYQDDWKLLRLFHNADDGAHEYRLYNLADDIGETTNLAAQHPERVESMATQIDTFLAETGAITPQPNPDYNSKSAALNTLGWSPTKNCTLNLRDDTLVITATGAAPSLRVVLPKPIPPGKITMRTRVITPTTRTFALRWEEQGVKPPYQQSRLTHAEAAANPNWQDLTFSFETDRQVVSFRLDPGKESAETIIGHWTIEHDGQVMQRFDFTTDKPIPATREFISIFNGKDLAGWEGSPEYWSVEDGALTGVTDGSLDYNRFITWKNGTVRNFDLRVKVKVTAGGNSGLQYRGQERPDLGDWVVTGYQCDVVPNNPGYNGMLYEERGRRILARTGEKVIIDPDGNPWIIGSMPVKEFPPDEWHDYRVLAEGNHHQHWIDGHPTVDVIDLDKTGRALEGVLAVQVHVGPAMKIQYKDFQIKHLPDNLPLVTSGDAPIPTDARGVRPQGKLPNDWTPPIYGEQQ